MKRTYVKPCTLYKGMTEQESILAASVNFSEDTSTGSAQLGGDTYTGGAGGNLSKRGSIWDDETEAND